MGASDGLFKSGGMNKVVCRFIWLFFVLGVVCANMNGQDQLEDQLQDHLQDIRIDTFNDMPASVENVTGGTGEFLWDWDKESNSQELTDFLRREIEDQQDVQTIVVLKIKKISQTVRTDGRMLRFWCSVETKRFLSCLSRFRVYKTGLTTGTTTIGCF